MSTPQPKKAKSFFLELPGLLLGALIIAILLKTIVLQPFYIPSESMLDTLQVNDRVIVWKLGADYQRGDIVVFQRGGADDDSATESVIRAILQAVGIGSPGTEDLIKRVIALGGDTIEIRDNQVFVNGAAVDEPYISDADMPDMELVTVPEGTLWVMGDHRCDGCSQDSRFIGPIPAEDVVGEAVFRIWPADRVGGL